MYYIPITENEIDFIITHNRNSVKDVNSKERKDTNCIYQRKVEFESNLKSALFLETYMG